MIEDLLEECELNKGTSIKRLKKSLETLEGTYVVKEGTTYKIIHDKVFDFLAKYFGEKMIQIFIDHANTDFIEERFLWNITDNMGTEIEFVIRIPVNYIDRYIDRILTDWENGFVNSVCQNRNMNSTAFTENLITHLNQLDLSKQQQLVSTKDIHSKDIALDGSCYMRTVDLVKWLIRRNSDINYCREDGWFQLLWASQEGHVDVVIELLQHSADVNKCASNGVSPLYIASQNEHVDVVKELLQHSADVKKCDNKGASPLYIASQEGHVDVVKELLHHSAEVNKCQNNGESSLFIASHNGHVDVVKELLKHSAEVNQCNNEKVSPLFTASQYGHLDVVQELLQYSANVNECDYHGRNALQVAQEHGHLEVESLLLGNTENFHKLLSAGTYESFENRVFLCGSCACGKSTLASVLIGSPIPLTWKSTDGLVIHFGRNGINLETYDMVPLKEEDNDQNILTKVVIGKPNTITHQSFDTHQHQINVQSSTATDNMESNVQVEKTDTDNDKRFKVSESPDACVREYQDIPVTHMITSETKKATPQVKKIEAYAVHDDILREVKSGNYKVKIAPSDLVDFGGQRSYDMTHQLFVQHGGTFVVMFDGRRDFHKPLQEYPTGDVSNESIVKHWVNSILTYCVDDEDIMPMIVFAATHSDMLSEDMQKKLKTEFVKKITDIFGDHEMKKHIVFDPVFFINGTDKDDHEIKILKNQLVSIARKQPSWGLRRPMNWVPLELQITNMKKDNINIIHKTHLTEANNMNGDLALSDKQLNAFLLTQHALGKIMYFNQPGNDNFIIIYPPALVNILRSFITDEIFWPEEETLRDILGSMTDTGKIYKKDLLKLWQQQKFHNDMPDNDFKEFIIQVLVHLDVLVQPKRYSGMADAYVDYYLVPCIVKHKMPMSFLDEKTFVDRTLSLVYRLHKSSIPSALSFKLIGAVSGIWPIKELYGRPLLYHSSAVVCVDGKTEFRIIVEDTKVVVFLTHITSKSSISPDIAASIQECLTRTLEIVLKFYLTNIGKSHQNVNVSDLFQIEVGEVCCRSACTVTVSEAKLKSSWICNNANSHSSIYSLLWVFNKTQEECLSDCPGLPNSILTNSPSELELARFADQLTNNTCMQLMVYLGLQSKDWEDIKDCYTGDGVRIMALHAWKTKWIKGVPTKTFGKLLEALKKIDDTRHLLCKVFREDTDLLDHADVRLQRIPDDDALKDLTKNIGNCAIQLGAELGVSMSSIKETMVRYHKDMYGQIDDILRKWKSSSKVTPTVYRLMLALERVDTGGLDCLKERYLKQ